MKKSWLLATVAIPALCNAVDLNTETKIMAFADCKILTFRASTQAQQTIVVTETPGFLVTRFCTTDGSLLITCSEADNKMVVTTSPYRNGCRDNYTPPSYQKSDSHTNWRSSERPTTTRTPPAIDQPPPISRLHPNHPETRYWWLAAAGIGLTWIAWRNRPRYKEPIDRRLSRLWDQLPDWTKTRIESLQQSHDQGFLSEQDMNLEIEKILDGIHRPG